MGQVDLEGSIVSSPGTSSDGTSVPTATQTIPLRTTFSPRPWQVEAGPNARQITSPSAYVTLSGVGATDTVTKGTFLYVRSNAPVNVRLTMVNMQGGSPVVSVVNLYGTLIQEFPDTGQLTLLEV